jgi:hypothetical protein
LAAIQENENTGMGKFINYSQLPDIAWDQILPEFFGISPISSAMVENMKEVAAVYSKGRGKSANQVWVEDITQKHDKATPEVVAAAHAFLSDIYDKMEALNQANI